MTPEAVPSVTLYSQPHCPSCRQVERFLEERGVTYQARDVLADPTALDEIVAQGFMTTPVVHIEDEWLVGFRPKELKRWLGREG